MTNARVDLGVEKAKQSSWIAVGLNIGRQLVALFLVPVLLSALFLYFVDFSTLLGDLKKLADGIKPIVPEQAPEATYSLIHALVTQLHAAQAQLGQFIKYIVSVAILVCGVVVAYVVGSYRFKSLTIDEMRSLRAELQDVRAEGLRLLPYGSDRDATRYFFHTDVWNHGVSEDAEDIDKSDLTIDIMFDGPAFQARNYLLSPKYLGYFFSKVKKKANPKIPDREFKRINPDIFYDKENPDISDNTRAVRIVIVDDPGESSSPHTQDLLVYLNMSALAGYATFMISKTRYEAALTIVESKLKQKAARMWEVRSFFEGHGSLLVSYKDKTLYVESATYDKLKGVGQPIFATIEDGDVRSALLDIAMNYFCFQPARIGRTGATLNNLRDLHNKLVNLKATPWTWRPNWTIASSAPREPERAA